MPALSHAFVVMPFGTKPGVDGQLIDFNRVYDEYIGPALEAAGLEAFRADQEMRAGDIRTDMFQELLVADLVVADLSIDNPNVWYELGVRHALRARGVVIVCGGKVTTAFDLYTDRKLRYGVKDGAPDPATLEDDKRKLTDMVKATMDVLARSQGQPRLPPDAQPAGAGLEVAAHRRRARVLGAARCLGESDRTRPQGRADWRPLGAGERGAGRRLSRRGLDQSWRGAAQSRALRICTGASRAWPGQRSRNLRVLREKGICLQRLALAGAPGHSIDRAREHYRDVLKLYPDDSETWALLGRVDKDAWIAAWRRDGQTPEQMRDDAAYEDALLRAAIDSYAKALSRQPGPLLLRHQRADPDAPLPPPHGRPAI